MEDELKKQIELFTNSNSLPKIDLRVVLPGSIRKTTLIELSTPEQQQQLEKCFSKINHDTPFIFSDICSKVFKDITTVKRITKEILEDWKKHNVIYMELVTNLYSKKEIFTKDQYLLAVLEEINEANNSLEKFNSRLIISLDKKNGVEDYEDILNIYNNIKNTELKKLIVGIDYSGNINEPNHRENNYQDIIPILEKFKQSGLGITIHVGENPNYQNFPINSFIPERISHGCFLKEGYINDLIRKKIHIEICPTYSYKVNKCIDYSGINMKKFWKKKIKKENGEEFVFDNISINSDCRTLLFTDISQEYYEVGLSFNLGINDLKNLIMRTIDFIFDKDEELHNKLKNILNNFNS